MKNPVSKVLQELLQELARRRMDEVTGAIKLLAGLTDRDRGVRHEQRERRKEDELKLLLVACSADRAGGGTHARRRFAGKRRPTRGARRPVDRILEHAGDVMVILGRRDDQGIGIGDHLLEPRYACWPIVVWLGDDVQSFVSDQHSAIASGATGQVWKLVAHESAEARNVTAGLTREQPEKIVDDVVRPRELTLPAHHDVRGPDDDWVLVVDDANRTFPVPGQPLVMERL